MSTAAFTLYGVIRLDGADSFANKMRELNKSVEKTTEGVTKLEQRTKAIGPGTATAARGVEKLNEKLNQQSKALKDAATAYHRGEISGKQFASALNRVETNIAGVNSRLRDGSARLTDYAARQTNVANSLRSLGSSASSFGQTLSIGLTLPLVAASTAFVRSASSIDAMRNRLVAATGSVELANQKMKELRALAQSSAGVFTESAVEMYAFLKPMKVGERTIETMIKALGRLKLANEELDAKRFSINLTQLYTQAFERTDLKEAVGSFPRFGEIMQKAFKLSGSDLKTVADEMKVKLKSGLTKDDFFKAIAESIEGDESLGKLTDTVGIRFQKMMERVFIAIEPLGNALLAILEPIAAAVTPVIEQLGKEFGGLSGPLKTAIVGFAGLAAAAGPLLIAIGAVISAITTIAGAISALGGLSAIAPVVGAVAAGILALAAAGAALYAAWTSDFGGIRTFTLETWNDIKNVTDSAMQAIVGFWKEHGEKIMSYVKPMLEFVKGTFTTVFVVLGGIVKTGLRLIRGDWDGAWAAVLETITKLAANVIEQGALLTRGLKVVLEDIIPFLAYWGTRFYIALHEWMYKAVIKAALTFATLPMKLIETVPAFISAAQSIGEAVMRGIRQGLSGGLLGGEFEDPESGLASQLRALQQRFGGSIAGLGGSFDPGGAGTALAAVPDKKALEKAAKAAKDIVDRNFRAQLEGVKIYLQKFLDEFQSAVEKVAESLTGMGDTTDEAIGQAIEGFSKYIARIQTASTALKKLQDSQRAGMTIEEQKLLTLQQQSDALKINENVQQILAKIKDAAGKADKERMDVALDQLKREIDLTKELLAWQTDKRNINVQLDQTGRDQVLANRPTMSEPPTLTWSNFWAMMQQQLGVFRDSLPSLKQSLGENLIGVVEGVAAVFGNAVAQWDGTARGFFRSLAQGFKQLVSQLLGELVRLMVMKAVLSLLGSFAGAGGGAGAGSAPGMLGNGLAEGGLIQGPGTGLSDSILARLSDGEFVVKARAVKFWGAGLLEQLNNMTRMPQMALAGGGMVGSAPMMGGSTYNNQQSFSPVFYINVAGGSPAQNQQTGEMIMSGAISRLYKHQNRNK